MLQIIGWLGCFILGIKLLEMQFNPALRDEDKGPGLDRISIVLAIGWLGVMVFALWLFAVGKQVEEMFEVGEETYGGYSESELRETADRNACEFLGECD